MSLRPALSIVLVSGTVHALAALARLLAYPQGWSWLELLRPAFAEGTLGAVCTLFVVAVAILFGRSPSIAAGATAAVWLAGQGAAWTWIATPQSRVTPSPSGGRTVVLITLDTMRADALGPWGGRWEGLSPRIDRFASEGLVFADARTPSPLTLPAHTTLLSGLHPADHGVLRNGERIPEDLRTVPEQLAEDGFLTAAFVSSSILHGRYGLARRFHVYRDELGPMPGARLLPLSRGVLAARARLVDAPVGGKEAGARTVDRAMRWLRAQPDDASVFLWVHLYDPHAPLERAPLDVEPPGHPCDWSAHPTALRRAVRSPIQPPRRPLRAEAACRAEDWATVFDKVGGYAAEVVEADTQVGRLLDDLGSLGRGDAAVLLVGDHGESLVEHQHLGEHQFSLYEPVLRVPFAVRAPELRAGVWPAPVSTTQVAAHLRALAAGDTPTPIPDATRIAVGPAPVEHARSRDIVGDRALQATAQRGARKVLVDEVGHVERYVLSDDPGERYPLLTEREQSSLRAPPPPVRDPLTLLRASEPEWVAEALAQPGVVGQRLDDPEPWASLEEAARDALRRARRSHGGVRKHTAELEALGYVE